LTTLTNHSAIKHSHLCSIFKHIISKGSYQEEKLTENKITFDDENGTPLGATSSFQASRQPHLTDYLYSASIESFCEIGLALLPY
jgi:hypothetical protein